MVVSLDLISVCQTFRFYVHSARNSCMKQRFQYLPYRRGFRRPLTTAHGVWRYREGIIIRVEKEDSQAGFGEIAPLPSFGTETMEDALSWCKEQAVDGLGLKAIPSSLPCCQWAVSSAFAEEPARRRFPVAALVDSLDTLVGKQDVGYQSFKIKIGVQEFSKEALQIEDYFQQLVPGQCMRLDANGGLSESDFSAWLEFLEGQPVEYLEQPLAPGLENRMLEMAEPFSTSIALDESIAGMQSLLEWKDWPGPLVVKPGLLGNVAGVVPERIVGSSVFETSFGLEAGLQFLARYQKLDTAIGFDTISYFDEDGWNLHDPGPFIKAGEILRENLQALWEEKQ